MHVRILECLAGAATAGFGVGFDVVASLVGVQEREQLVVLRGLAPLVPKVRASTARGATRASGFVRGPSRWADISSAMLPSTTCSRCVANIWQR